MEEPGFWDDPDRSTRLVREAKNLKDEVGTFRELEQEYEDIQVMIQKWVWHAINIAIMLKVPYWTALMQGAILLPVRLLSVLILVFNLMKQWEKF